MRTTRKTWKTSWRKTAWRKTACFPVFWLFLSRLALPRLAFLPLASLLLVALLLVSCAKDTKQVGGGRNAVRVSAGDVVLDPRFSVFLSKAYFAVASRREAVKRVKLIKKGRRAARGEIVDPAEVKRGRRWRNEDTAWVRQQRQKLDALLATVAGENTAMFASAALAQANFDCWYYEMYKAPLTSRNSGCALDLAAALGAVQAQAAGSQQAFPNRENLSGALARPGAQQGFATGQQFSLLERYLERRDIDTLLMLLKRGDTDMKEIVEKLVQQELQQAPGGRLLPVWKITFKGEKRKLGKAGKKTIKRIAEWYKTQGQSGNLRIEASALDAERVEGIIAALVKRGVAEQSLLYGESIGREAEAGEGEGAGEITIRAQRSTQGLQP